MNDKPKRRRFRFSLRTLLLVVTVCSGGFGWFAYKMRQADEQKAVIQIIRVLGGYVVYDYQTDSNGWKHYLPMWLPSRFGDDLFFNVESVLFFDSNDISDNTLMHLAKHLVRLPQLKSLNLQDTKVTDTGMDYLKSLTQLKKLYLEGAKVTDEGCKELQMALPDLKIER